MAAMSLQAQSLLTLEAVIQTVLKNNLAIQIARNEQRIAGSNYHIGNAGFLPTLDVNLGGTATHPYKQQNPYHMDLSAGCKLNWNLFSGMQSRRQYQHLGQLCQISRLQTQQTVEEKVAEAIKGYYNLVIEQEKMRVLESNLVVAREVLALARAKYEVGRAAQLDCLAAQVQYNKEKAKLLTQEEALAAAKLSLCSLLNREGLGPDEWTAAEAIPLPQLLTWETVTATNPSILAAHRQCEDAAIAVKLQQAKLWPRIDFCLGYNLGSRYREQAWAELPAGFQYGININFNLFHAFQHTTAIQEAKIKSENALLHLANEQALLEMKLQQQLLRHTQQCQRYELLKEHVELSKESASAALEQYRWGRVTLLELNKARQSMQEAELEHLQVVHEAKVTEITLLQLGGRLLDHYGNIGYD